MGNGIAAGIVAVVLLLAAAVAIAPTTAARAESHALVVEDVGEVHTLTEDHEGPIVVAGVGATLDCAGWSVLGAGEDVGVSIEADGVTVRNCTITGFVIGIASHDTSGGVVDGNVVVEPGVGIGLEVVSGYTVTGNRVEDPGESAFQFVAMTDSEVVGNDAVNEASDFGAGFQFSDCSIGNLVERNTSFGGDGFNFWRSGGNHVVGNTATGNPNLAAYEGTDNFLFNQSPPTEEPCGEETEETEETGNTVERNTSIASGGQGFRVDGSPGTTLLRNVARDAGGAGFGVWEGSDWTVVSRNVATGNRNGVLVAWSSDVTVERNTVEDSGLAGIIVLEAGAVHVERNQSNRSGGSGIISLRSNGIDLVRNSVEGNGLLGQDSAGLYVASSTQVLVEANKACGNSLHDAVEYAAPDTEWLVNEFCEALYERPPHLEVSASNDFVRGFGFAPNGDVSMQVLDESGGVIAADPGVGTDGNGEFWWFVGDDIRPGHVAEVIDGDRSVEVADLTFDVFDVDGDVLGGTAAPGSAVVLRGGDDVAPDFELEGVAAVDGTWSFDVAAQAGFDVGHGMWAEVFQYEPDGDATVEERPASPYLLASPDGDYVVGLGFAPGPVTVTIGDLEYEVESVEPDGFRLDDAVEAGDLIVAEGAVYTKELVVSELSFEADPGEDVIAGLVDPPTFVWIDLGDAGFEAEVGEDGNWELRLWEFEYDLQEGQGITAFAYDGDGDATISAVEGDPPTPVIRVNYQNDWVEGWDFTPGAMVDLLVGGVPFQVEADEWGYFNIEVWDVVDVEAGDLVSATDGVRAPKSLTVVDLTFDTFDPATGTVAGRAPAGTTVTLQADVEAEVVADGEGRWETTVDGLSDEWWVDATVIDEDGDQTLAHRPPPRMVVGSISGQWVDGQGFLPGESLDLTVGDESFVGVGVVGDGSGFSIDVGSLGVVLSAGTTVEVSDGTNVETHTLEAIAFDLDGTLASGTTTPDALVSVGVWGPLCGEELFDTADGAGAFAIDIAGGACGGEFGGEPGGPDVGVWARVYASDTSSNATQIDLPPTPVIRVNYQNDWVEGWDFTPGAMVDLLVGGVPFQVEADEWGYFNIEVWDVVDIVVGDVVTADDGVRLAKSLTVVDLTFDTFDPATETLAGGAPEGTTVSLQADVELEVVAGVGDRWQTTVAGLTDDWYIDATVIDADGDQTLVHRPPSPVIVASYESDWVWGQGFVPGATIEVTVNGVPYPGGTAGEHSELFVQLSDLGGDLEPGTELVVSDGATTRTLELTEVTASYDGATVSGMTVPLAELSVGVAGADCAESMLTTADAGGAFSVDTLTGEGCMGGFGDLHNIWVEVLDDDGDATNIDVPVGG